MSCDMIDDKSKFISMLIKIYHAIRRHYVSMILLSFMTRVYMGEYGYIWNSDCRGYLFLCYK